jgi:hypothetical protein
MPKRTRGKKGKDEDEKEEDPSPSEQEEASDHVCSFLSSLLSVAFEFFHIKSTCGTHFCTKNIAMDCW